jgi:site-specific DNA-methyltransferase (adenine-specific)
MINLYCGDCAHVMQAHIADASIDLTVTSPPYDALRSYNGYTFDFEAIATELYRVTKPGGVAVWVVGDQTINGSETLTSFSQAQFFKGLGFFVHDTMIYENQATGAKGSNYAYWQSFEYMFVLAKGRPKTVNLIADKKNITGGKLSGFSPKMESLDSRTMRPGVYRKEFGIRTNIWRYHAGENDRTPHPAPFPEKLAGDHILSWSNPGDLVFDPMCGSGTTGKMAKYYGRDFIGIDISADYVELAQRRIGNTQQPLPLLVAA